MTGLAESPMPEATAGPALDPSAIMAIGTGFMPAKILLSAVELDLFTVLGSGRRGSGEPGASGRTGAQVADELALRSRAVYDFLDALLALGLLERDGSGPEALYRNTPETGAFLDKNAPGYMGGFLEMANARLYRYWADLPEGLRTGLPQTEIKHTGRSVFEELYSSPEGLEQFMQAMAGISAASFQSLAQRFDFSRFQTLCDAGGATGQLSTIVSAHHPHLLCTSFDLPPVEPIARRCIAEAGASDRVTAVSGDFLAEPLPKADVITMGLILHDWNLERKLHLIRSAYDALPEGGALIAVENLIDDDRRENAFGLQMSLNMLIEFGDAFDFTGADFRGWCEQVGFRTVEIIPLGGPTSAAVAYK